MAQFAHAGLQPLVLDVAGQCVVVARERVVQMAPAAIERARDALDGQVGVAQMPRHVVTDAILQGRALGHRGVLPGQLE